MRVAHDIEKRLIVEEHFLGARGQERECLQVRGFIDDAPGDRGRNGWPPIVHVGREHAVGTLERTPVGEADVQRAERRISRHRCQRSLRRIMTSTLPPSATWRSVTTQATITPPAAGGVSNSILLFGSLEACQNVLFSCVRLTALA